MSSANKVVMDATINSIHSGNYRHFEGDSGSKLVNVVFRLSSGAYVPFTIRVYQGTSSKAAKLLEDVACVGSMHELKGKKVRVLYNPYSRPDERICAIGHITDDRWFNPMQAGERQTCSLSELLK